MRTARIGLLVGYLLLVAAVASVYLVGRFGPDLGKFVFAIIFSAVSLLSSAVAFAIFGGSVVCATQALVRERTSRRFPGFVTFLLSLLSAFGLGGLYIWAMTRGH